MNVEPALLGDVEQAQQRGGVGLEKVVRRYRQPFAIEHEPVEPAPADAPAHPGKPALALLVGFEDGAEDPGQVADILGDQKIVLHEALDPATAGMVGVAHALPDLALQVEGQPLLGASGEKMQMAAHRPQKALRPGETLRFFSRQHTEIDEFGDIVDAIDIFGEPEQGVQVSEPALALLDIGFELIAAVADAAMALVALGELGLDELRRGAACDLAVEALLELAEQRFLTPQITRLEQAGADRQIRFRLAQALLDRARRLPDPELEVPQQIEQQFDDLLGVGGLLVGQQE